MNQDKLRLTKDNAMLIMRHLADAAAAGKTPTVVIDDLRGLNREFIDHLINSHPKCVFSKRAATQLLQSPSTFSICPTRKWHLALWLAFVAVLSLVITAIAAGAIRWR